MAASTKSIIISTVILLVILVVLPLITVKYLQKGLEYRVEQVEKLENFGALELTTAENTLGFIIDTADLQKKITVVVWADYACSTDAITYLEYLEKFVRFDAFLAIVVTDGKRCELDDRVYFAPLVDNPYLIKQLDKVDMKRSSAPRALLVDRRGDIRKVYDLTQLEEVEALVAHTSLLLPPQKDRGK